MQTRQPSPRAWATAANAVLLLAGVFLAGIWAGLLLSNPPAPPTEPALAQNDTTAVPPQFRRVAAPEETAPVSHDGPAWNLRARQDKWNTAPVAPALNMRETPAGYDISVSLSGVHPKDLNIRTERSLIIIQASLTHPTTGQSVSTEGRLRIPPDAQLDATTSAFSNGYLHISIPRRTE